MIRRGRILRCRSRGRPGMTIGRVVQPGDPHNEERIVEEHELARSD